MRIEIPIAKATCLVSEIGCTVYANTTVSDHLDKLIRDSSSWQSDVIFIFDTSAEADKLIQLYHFFDNVGMLND